MTKDDALRLMFEEEHFDGPPVGVFAEADGSFPSGWIPMLRRRGQTILNGERHDLLIFFDLLSKQDDVNIWWIGQWALGWALLRPEETREVVTLFVSDPQNWVSTIEMCREIGHSCVFDWIAMVLRIAAESELLTEEVRGLALDVISFNLREVSLPTYKNEIMNYVYDLTGSEDFVRKAILKYGNN